MKRFAKFAHAFIASCLLICVGSTSAQTQPDPIQAAIQAAIDKGRSGDLDGAIADLTKLIEKNPKSSAAYMQRGFAWLDKGKIDEALGDLNKAIEIGPAHPAARAARAWIRQERGQYDEALADLDKAIEENPNSPRLYHDRAQFQLGRKNFAKAIADFDKAIALAPNDMRYYVNRSLAKTRNDDLKGAIEDADAAIKLAPQEPRAYTTRAAAISRAGENLERALGDCKKALALNPNETLAYWIAGYVHVELGDPESAIAQFSAALKIDPRYTDAYEGRAVAYYLKQDWKNALADIKKDSTNDPEHAIHNEFFIWAIRTRAGDPDPASKGLAPAIDRYSRGKPDPWVETLGKFLIDKAAEKSLFDAAVSSDAKTQASHQCQAYYYSGVKKFLLGDKAAALESFKKCIATKSRHDREFTLANGEIKLLGK